MKFIVENWFVIVAIAAVGGSIGYAIYSFVKMPSDKQLNKVREWLLYAVTKAEKEDLLLCKRRGESVGICESLRRSETPL